MTSPRVALITGITGQDGGLLAKLLLSKGYQVHGVRRRSTGTADGLDQVGEAGLSGRVTLHYGDMTDAASLMRIVSEVRPAELYNLAAQSHVHVSFEKPAYTTQVNAAGCLHLLDAIRLFGLEGTCRFYQASTSELYGDAHATPQDEATPFRPRSPYAISKHFAYQMTVLYREAYGLHASNGILFNHEGKARGENFVSRKITLGAARWALGQRSPLALGNLAARRDWGDARDYVRGMWQIVQQASAGDYVLATGVSRSVREFASAAYAAAGVTLAWRGEGLHETGVDLRTGEVAVKVDPQFFRPADVNALTGDAGKARRAFGWRPDISFETMVQEMVEADIAKLRVQEPASAPAAPVRVKALRSPS
jgi:GDPmannose 4,6-dehydratase